MRRYTGSTVVASAEVVLTSYQDTSWALRDYLHFQLADGDADPSAYHLRRSYAPHIPEDYSYSI